MSVIIWKHLIPSYCLEGKDVYDKASMIGIKRSWVTCHCCLLRREEIFDGCTAAPADAIDSITPASQSCCMQNESVCLLHFVACLSTFCILSTLVFRIASSPHRLDHANIPIESWVFTTRNG